MPDMMKAVVVKADQPLALEDVQKPEITSNEVLLRVRASGLNRADLLQRRGLYPPPKGASQIMGLECAGEIVALGDAVDDWSIGDRVCALLAGGGYAEYAAVDQGSLLPIPDGMDFVAAACLPEAMMTVWANVYDRCNLQVGESFLVHGGTSGIGVMAIQMARTYGASAIYATAGSDEKCRVCADLGATRAINYKSEAFDSVILG
ncbi:MAG: alcohol dehydrogenase catalytic domain-containing protein, partial [Pseudomonadota bacterium]